MIKHKRCVERVFLHLFIEQTYKIGMLAASAAMVLTGNSPFLLPAPMYRAAMQEPATGDGGTSRKLLPARRSKADQNLRIIIEPYH